MGQWVKIELTEIW